MNKLLFLLLAIPAGAFAVTEPVYQAVFHLSENGAKVGSASVIVQEGKEGVINSITEGAGAGVSSYRITIKSAPGNSVQADFHFEGTKEKRKIEFGETFAPITLGKTITAKLVDSTGDSFEVNIVVTKPK